MNSDDNAMLNDRKRSPSSPQTSGGKKSRQGFTLLELVIVITVMGILATIAFPSFLHWLPNIRLKSAARDLYSNMQKAKINAIKANKEWAIIFNPTTSYSIYSDPGADKNWVTTADNTLVETVELANYRSGIKIGHGNAAAEVTGDPFGDNVTYTNNVATFDPRGFGKAGYVYLDNEDNTSFAIGTPITGAIKLLRWQGAWK